MPRSSQFYIPATSSLQERRPRTLKHGDTFGVFDHNGDIVPGAGSPEGLYHRDTRFLSGLQLLINDRRPLLLSSTLRDDNAMLTCDLTNPDLFDDGRRPASGEGHDPHLRAQVHLAGGAPTSAWRCAISTRARHDDPPRLCCSPRLRRPVRGARPAARARRGRIAGGDARATMRSLRLHRPRRRLQPHRLHFAPQPIAARAVDAAFEVCAGAGRARFAVPAVECDGDASARPQAERFFAACARRAGRCAPRPPAPRRSPPRTRSSTRRSAARSPISTCWSPTRRTAPTPMPACPGSAPPSAATASSPRMQTAVARPRDRPRRAALPRRHSGRRASTRGRRRAGQDPARDAPGRDGAARRGAVPPLLRQRRFDAAVRHAGRALSRAHRRPRDHPRALAEHRGGAALDRRATATATATASSNTPPRASAASANQGWKDSQRFDLPCRRQAGRGRRSRCARCRPTSTPPSATPPGWPARSASATLADALRGEAAALRERFEAAFWCDDLGDLRAGARRRQEPCRVRSSNAGHALLTGIASPRRAAPRRRRADGPALLLAAGASARSPTGEARYNPMSYHNGSVWPHDNALIALGLARYGLSEPAAAVRGPVRRRELHRPAPPAGAVLRLPRACRAGADVLSGRLLAAGLGGAAPFALLQACLGLSFDPAGERSASASRACPSSSTR